MDVSLSKLWEMVKGREAWHAAARGVTKSWTRLSGWTTMFSTTHSTSFPFLSLGKFRKSSRSIRRPAAVLNLSYKGGASKGPWQETSLHTSPWVPSMQSLPEALLGAEVPSPRRGCPGSLREAVWGKAHSGQVTGRARGHRETSCGPGPAARRPGSSANCPSQRPRGSWALWVTWAVFVV